MHTWWSLSRLSHAQVFKKYLKIWLNFVLYTFKSLKKKIYITKFSVRQNCLPQDNRYHYVIITSVLYFLNKNHWTKNSPTGSNVLYLSNTLVNKQVLKRYDVHTMSFLWGRVNFVNLQTIKNYNTSKLLHV